MSYFRTTETGELEIDGGKLIHVTVKSPALQARGDLSLYLPQAAIGQTNLPVVTLLHGVYGSHWIWALKGEAHTTLNRLIQANEVPPMILAMPSDGLWGDGSAYLPHHEMDFEKWIIQDVPHAVNEVTGNTIHSPHFIAGLSMGGYGAMRLGAKYHDRYTAFAGHSSITAVSQLKHFVEEPLESYPDERETSVAETIINNRKNVQPFRFDCGKDDILIDYNRTLCSHLQDEGIEFTYEEYDGGHEWPYWQSHIATTYRFFAEQV